MNIPVSLGKDSYNITLERGCIKKAHEIFSLRRKVLIVTDEGVPFAYAQSVAKGCSEPVVVTVEAGESSKNLDNFKMLCETMLQKGFNRKDCVVAVGGGVVGDLAGFAAACYMRGIDFYNVPTTLLAQVDSSVGGKTAVDLGEIKNIVGAFYQPKAVLIDPEVLDTLSKEQLACGAAEIIKMAAAFDPALFKLIEEKGIEDNLDEVIAASLKIKAEVVSKDEKESGLRKALNFGHTIGHGIESVTGMLHGQCVALGMIPMTKAPVRDRLVSVLEKNNLPTLLHTDSRKVIDAVMHDKKAEGNFLVTVQLEEIGSFKFVNMDKSRLKLSYEEVWG